MKLFNKKLPPLLQQVLWPLVIIAIAILFYYKDFCGITISWKDLISLLTVIIWPLTVIICLLLFRQKLTEIMGSLGTLKAGKDGIEMTFQNKLDNVEGLIGIGDGGNGGQSKSSGKLNMQTSSSGTPYQQLMEVRDVLNNKVVQRAKELNIPTENTSSLVLCEKLKEVGGITIKNLRAFKALMELTNEASQNISQSQVDQIKAMVLKINIK